MIDGPQKFHGAVGGGGGSTHRGIVIDCRVMSEDEVRRLNVYDSAIPGQPGALRAARHAPPLPSTNEQILVRLDRIEALLTKLVEKE